MIRMVDVCFAYEKKLTLSSINVNFQSEIVGLVGSNGSGKSTLMKLISTLIEPDSGEIYYRDKQIRNTKKEYLKKIGFCMQITDEYDKLTVKEYLNYFACLKSIKADNAKNRINHLLTAFNLNEYESHFMNQLSGGTLRRVGLCNALLTDPEVLLLDEPTNGLDLSERKNFYNLLKQNSENKLVIISSHITNELFDLCDSILFMKNGKCIHFDKANEYKNMIEDHLYMVEASTPLIFNNGNTLLESSMSNDIYKYKYVVESPTQVLNNSTKILPEFSDVFMYLNSRD